MGRLFGKDNGRKKISEEVKRQMGTEREDFKEARDRAESELQRVTQVINNLLDNITPTNREHVDQRLKDLTLQRKQIETRLDELDRLTTAQSKIQTIVADASRYFSGLEFTLREGLPQEKLTALRQCIERIHINKPNGRITITALAIPCGNLNAKRTIEVSQANHAAAI